MILSQELLKSQIFYDPENGAFARLAGIPIATKLTAKGYLRFKVFGKMYMAHRLAWLYMTGEFPVGQVDHKNRIRSDNCWDNLRGATNSKNQFNASLRKDNVSGYKNVSFDKNTGKWRAYMQNNKKWKHLGLYNSAEEASNVVQAYAVPIRADFAHF